MPAYFSINFQYKKSEINTNLVKDFCDSLIQSGLKFQSGFWGFENDTLEDIVSWNQKKLESNFELGFTEHYSNDYKQILFDFYEFSETRVYIFNSSNSNTFGFNLIIPEEDFIEDIELDGKYVTRNWDDRMKIIEKLLLEMWDREKLSCIQTSWECSDCVTEFSDIIKGVSPLIEPLAIVPKDILNDAWNCDKLYISRNGVLLQNNENWLYM